MRLSLIPLFVAALWACGPSTSQPAGPAANAETEAPPMAGPMKPTHTPPALAAAPGFLPADVAELEKWLASRAASAKGGAREHVRVPVFKRTDAATCECPPFAVGQSPASPHTAIKLVDLTSIGTAAYAKDGAQLWVEGRFTVESGTTLPTLEVVRAGPRMTDEPLRFAAPAESP